MKRLDVVCIGSATVDHILVIDRKRKDISLGDKVLVKERHRFTGGGATNAAVALAKLGVKAQVMAKSGDDHDADFISQTLKKYKIKLLVKRKSDLPTSSSSIIMSRKERDRVIYVYKGASNDLRLEDVPLGKMKRVKWVYLASLVGKSFQTGIDIVKYCRRKKVKVLFNASSYLARQGKSKLHPLLQATTILVLNKKEARLLLKAKEKDTRKLLKDLQELGPESVVITHGRKTLHALHENKFYSVKPSQTKVVDTTGAGDAFTATLLGMLVRKHDFPTALKLAVKNAQSVIKNHGAKEGLLGYGELVGKR